MCIRCFQQTCVELLLECGADPHAVNNKGQCVILASQVLTAATIFHHVHETKHKEHNRNRMEMDKEDAEAQTTPPPTQGTLSIFFAINLPKLYNCFFKK